jgi:hypothetical protein
MLSLQTILLTFSLLLVVGMVASLMCLAALRAPAEQEAVRVEVDASRPLDSRG